MGIKKEKRQLEAPHWYCVSIDYDNYKQDMVDSYQGDIFGYCTMFESPHYLFRRFHRNFCKALFLVNLPSYILREDSNDELIVQTREIIYKNYSIKTIAMHNVLILMVSAVDTFLKDSFIQILNNVYPQKKGSNDAVSISKRYSFQNTHSIKKTFS